MKKKVDISSKPLGKLMSARSLDPVLKDTGTEQVQQILQASLSVEPYER